MIFPGLGSIDAAVDNFQSQEFSPSNSDSLLFSIQADVSGAVNPQAANYSIMGSNISKNEVDMVPYKSDASSLPLATAWVGENFPFKYIGIKYTTGIGSSGVITFHYEQKALRVNIS